MNLPFIIATTLALTTCWTIQAKQPNTQTNKLQKPNIQNNNNQKVQKPISTRIGYYLGGFGGWGFNHFDVVQKGIAFYLSDKGGPLVVDSAGRTQSNGFGFGGLHIGYESLSEDDLSWSFTPTVELEGYYFSQTKKVTLVNPTDRLDFHEFVDTFPIRAGVLLTNFQLALTNDFITPYVGIGIGAGIVSIHKAFSEQTAFPEPGINHFNSNPNSFNWNFAAQIKTGLSFSPWDYLRFFAEYRFLFLAATDYTFGHTVYPGHVATADWNIRFGGICSNLFCAGIDFPL